MLRCTTCDHPEILVTTECEPGQQQAVAGPVQTSTDTAAAAAASGGTATLLLLHWTL